MRLTKRAIVLVVSAVLMVAASAPAMAKPDLIPGQPVYLALGDSWAWGQGATDPATGGYTALLSGMLLEELDCSPAASDNAADGCKHLQYVNLARPGTATQPGVTAPIVATEQLPIALPLLAARNGDANPSNDVEVVTLHVGGNDVSGPIQMACLGGFTPECQATFATEMSAFAADLAVVVAQLRAAAGPDTPIILGTYDNPVPTCWLNTYPGAEQLGDLLLEGSLDGSIPGVHDIIRGVAAAYGASVAETYGTLAPEDFVGGQDCLHIVDSGHEKVASQFAAIAGS